MLEKTVNDMKFTMEECDTNIQENTDVGGTEFLAKIFQQTVQDHRYHQEAAGVILYLIMVSSNAHIKLSDKMCAVYFIQPGYVDNFGLILFFM